jgi:hypothetical protein
MPRALLTLSTLLGVCVPLCAHGSEHGRFGLIARLADTASVGVEAHLSERFVLRPHVSYAWVRSDNAPTLIDLEQEYSVFETTERYYGAGLDALFAPPTSSPLGPYFGLGLNVSRADVPYPALDSGNLIYRNGGLNRLSAFALLGAQYSFNHHLAIYGEAAFGYSLSERFGFGGHRLRSREWGTLSPGLGVVLYLR